MVFYFSATGNTKWAARKIAEATHEKLLFIPELVERRELDFDLEDNERIGFCFPVHGWRPPLLVRDFIRQLNIRNASGHYCYALCTAGDTIGETFDYIEKDLLSSGLHLDARFSLLMPESYVGLPFMDVDTPRMEKQKKDKAALELKGYIGIIERRLDEDGRIVKGRWPKTNSRLLGHVFLHHLITDKRFYVDSSKCIKCGLCVKSCPVGDITMEKEETPRWQNNGRCMTCFSCYHHCPVRAIEFGVWTRGKGQYYFERSKSHTADCP